MLAYTVSAVLAGVAFQHIAYILQYGSIFELHRNWLSQHPRRPHGLQWVRAKTFELVMCQLCTTTQLSFWLWALPLIWVGSPIQSAVGTAMAFPIVWFSQAAISLAMWDLARLFGRGTDALILAARALKK